MLDAPTHIEHDQTTRTGSSKHSPSTKAASRRNKQQRRAEAPSKPYQIRKLQVQKPPSFVSSSSTSGPKTSLKDSRNHVCVTRKTPLGAYLRQLKEIVLKEGYSEIYLTALGAAIPHLLTLTVSLPAVLPFPEHMIQTTVTTDTTEACDELIPEDENEDISLRTRNVARLNVQICITGGKRGYGHAKIDPAAIKDGTQDSIKTTTSRMVHHEVEISDESMDD